MSQQRKGDLYTFIFAASICVVCALVLSLAATALKPMQMENARHDVVVNMMSTVGQDVAELRKLPKDEIFAKFEEEFDTILLNKDNEPVERGFMEDELLKLNYPKEELEQLDTGLLLARFNTKIGLLARKNDKSRSEYDPGLKVLYTYKEGGETSAYIVPIEGYGLWDLMKGYIALGLDLNTVKGITFYEHKETPGLGARVEEAWFKENFIGKKILDQGGDLVAITVVKGEAPDDALHRVDGISGATLTGDGINEFLLRNLSVYEPYFKTLRN